MVCKDTVYFCRVGEVATRTGNTVPGSWLFPASWGDVFMNYKKYLLGVLMPVVFAGLAVAEENELKRFEFDSLQMGVPVRLLIYADLKSQATDAAKDVFDRFGKLNAIMSDYDSESELSELCRRGSEALEREPHQPIWISVSDDLFTVLAASKHYCEISDGVFDITVGPMVRLWRRSRRQHELPKQRHLDRVRQLVGNDLWELDEKSKSVRILKAGVKFDLGGIAKGYAIDQAFDILRRNGLAVFLIDAGGDLRVADAPKDGWSVLLADRKSVKIRLENRAMATSGDAERFVEIDGVRYSHLIDPVTGLGLTRTSTVHVAAPTAMEADALASAFSILEPEKALTLAKKLKNVSVKIVLQGNVFVYGDELNAQ